MATPCTAAHYSNTLHARLALKYQAVTERRLSVRNTLLNMAESAGAKANAAAAGAMGEHASTIMGIGKEAFQTETDGVTKTLYSAEIARTCRALGYEAQACFGAQNEPGVAGAGRGALASFSSTLRSCIPACIACWATVAFREQCRKPSCVLMHGLHTLNSPHPSQPNGPALRLCVRKSFFVEAPRTSRWRAQVETLNAHAMLMSDSSFSLAVHVRDRVPPSHQCVRPVGRVCSRGSPVAVHMLTLGDSFILSQWSALS